MCTAMKKCHNSTYLNMEKVTDMKQNPHLKDLELCTMFVHVFYLIVNQNKTIIMKSQQRVSLDDIAQHTLYISAAMQPKYPKLNLEPPVHSLHSAPESEKFLQFWESHCTALLPQMIKAIFFVIFSNGTNQGVKNFSQKTLMLA